jgi:hypothetical protein
MRHPLQLREQAPNEFIVAQPALALPVRSDLIFFDWLAPLATFHSARSFTAET